MLCRGQGPIRHREMAKKTLCLNQHKGRVQPAPSLIFLGPKATLSEGGAEAACRPPTHRMQREHRAVL